MMRSAIVMAGLLGVLLSGCSVTRVEQSPYPTQEAESPYVSPMNQTISTCLLKSGWSTTVDSSGALLSPTFSEDDEAAAYSADLTSCSESASAQFAPTSEQMERIYYAELVERQCLEDRGFSIPEPPTLEAYVASYDTYLWMAMSYVDPLSMSQEEWDSLNERCPQPQQVPGLGPGQ